MKRSTNPKTQDRLEFERDLWSREFTLVAGVDEAGRGPLAGPVVAAAVFVCYSPSPQPSPPERGRQKQRFQFKEGGVINPAAINFTKRGNKFSLSRGRGRQKRRFQFKKGGVVNPVAINFTKRGIKFSLSWGERAGVGADVHPIMKRATNPTTQDRLEFERDLWSREFTLVAGVDEAGRGPLAGPVVAAAVFVCYSPSPQPSPPGRGRRKQRFQFKEGGVINPAAINFKKRGNKFSLSRGRGPG